jgi:hypothetical protein
LSPLASRLILVLLIARAVAAPVALRPRVADRAVRGFELRFLAGERDLPTPSSLQPQYSPHAADSGLVFRVCFWPPPKHRAGSSDLLRRTAKTRATAWCSHLIRRTGEARMPASLANVVPTLSTDRYVRHALGQQRC